MDAWIWMAMPKPSIKPMLHDNTTMYITTHSYGFISSGRRKVEAGRCRRYTAATGM